MYRNYGAGSPASSPGVTWRGISPKREQQDEDEEMTSVLERMAMPVIVEEDETVARVAEAPARGHLGAQLVLDRACVRFLRSAGDEAAQRPRSCRLKGR